MVKPQKLETIFPPHPSSVHLILLSHRSGLNFEVDADKRQNQRLQILN